MLTPETAALVVVDVQGRLAGLMHDAEALFRNLRRLLQGARIFGLPILVTEQNPAGLGPTRAEIADLLAEVPTIPKLAFSCCGEPRFTEALDALARRQILLAGIETHVCVCQTAADLLHAGYTVEVVADAVSSRTAASHAIGLQRMQQLGATVTCVETALFELCRVAQGPEFKALLKLVK